MRSIVESPPLGFELGTGVAALMIFSDPSGAAGYGVSDGGPCVGVSGIGVSVGTGEFVTVGRFRIGKSSNTGDQHNKHQDAERKDHKPIEARI